MHQAEVPSEQRRSSQVAITWKVSDLTGWGILGLNILLESAVAATRPPLALEPSVRGIKDPETRERIGRLIELQAPPAEGRLSDTAVIHGVEHMSNALPEISRRHVGDRNVAITFVGEIDPTDELRENIGFFDLIIGGSSWLTSKLRDMGAPNAATWIQGIHPAFFQPAPARRIPRDRFVVFSGAKLEYRKGQDILVAAFKRFRERHPEALLLTAWDTLGTATAGSIAASPHAQINVTLDGKGRPDFARWLTKNGLSPEDFACCPLVSNHEMPAVLANADVAVFPSRCEGGTNMPAMECLAFGLPTILSANTGHLDLASEETCYPLWDQQPARLGLPVAARLENHRESSVDELVERLEEVYRDRDAARARGEAARERMRPLRWDRQVRALLGMIGVETRPLPQPAG